jgi:hypothetical protein
MPDRDLNDIRLVIAVILVIASVASFSYLPCGPSLERSQKW